MQLMQQYVQKSRTTTWPLRSLIEMGLSVFNQPSAPVKSGAAFSAAAADVRTDIARQNVTIAIAPRFRPAVIAPPGICRPPNLGIIDPQPSPTSQLVRLAWISL